MKRSSSILLAAGAVLAGLGLWWLAGLGETRPTESTNPNGPETPTGATAPPTDLEGSRVPGAGGRTSSSSQPPPSVPDAPPEPQGTISGAVVDSRNRGLGGVEVTAVLGVARDVEAYDAEAKSRERIAARTRTDSEGRFALEIARGREHELRASAVGYAPGVVPGVHAGERATILLRRGATLNGTARRKEGGAPVGGARVVLLPAGGRTVAPEWEGRTDANGAYLAENLPPGAHILFVIPEKLASSADRVTLAEGETRTHDVSIPTGMIVLGEVKDVDTGLPIAGAEVSPYEFLLLVVRTDASGRYECAGIDAEAASITVWARAPGYGVYEASAEPRDGGVVQADFSLARSRGARGRVVARDGAPVADATVLACASLRDGAITRSDKRTARSGEDGRFRIADLRTDLPHGIVVRKERFAEALAKTIEAGIAGEIDLGDLVLAPGASLEGSVSTAAGDPLQAAGVTLLPGRCGGLERCPLERYAMTDAKGVFRFADLSAGAFRIEVQAEGVPARKEGWTVTLAEGEAKAGFRIVVGEGRSIAGRVVDSVGLGVEGAQIELYLPGSPTPANQRTQTSSDGKFQVNGLDADEYDVEAKFRDEHGPPDDRHRLIDARASRVAAGTTDLSIELRRAAEIAGRVAGLDDPTPEARPFLLAVGDDGRRIAGEHLSPDGRFVVRVPAGEFVELRAWTAAPESIVRGPATADPDHPPQAVKAGVRGGDQGVVLHVKP